MRNSASKQEVSGGTSAQEERDNFCNLADVFRAVSEMYSNNSGVTLLSNLLKKYSEGSIPEDAIFFSNYENNNIFSVGKFTCFCDEELQACVLVSVDEKRCHVRMISGAKSRVAVKYGSNFLQYKGEDDLMNLAERFLNAKTKIFVNLETSEIEWQIEGSGQQKFNLKSLTEDGAYPCSKSTPSDDSVRFNTEDTKMPFEKFFQKRDLAVLQNVYKRLLLLDEFTDVGVRFAVNQLTALLGNIMAVEKTKSVVLSHGSIEIGELRQREITVKEVNSELEFRVRYTPPAEKSEVMILLPDGKEFQVTI
ncbi:hypothetical protein IT418_03710 [bacterium]|nr:hypothetical protein [bacterium]